MEDLVERCRTLLRTPDAHRVAGSEKRLEVRQPLDVIPVGVRQQDLCLHGAVLTFDERQTETANAGPGVENHELPAGSLYGHARRIPAVARGVGPGGWDRASRPPESHRVGYAVGHAQLIAKLRKIGDVGQVGRSPEGGDQAHRPYDRPAADSNAERSRITMSRRDTSM